MTKQKITNNGISVIMPTYNQSSFIALAINSLINQTHTNWELIIINDGCTDDTDETVMIYKNDKRISYYKNSENQGLGKCVNLGISKAKFNYISYLPSDDIYFPEHLSSLLNVFMLYPSTILAFSGVMQADYDVWGTREVLNKRNLRGGDLLLVQVMHKKNDFEWMERSVCTTSDYSRMYWNKLSTLGAFIPTNQITCQWINHPNQRNKKIRSGLNVYRNYYNVKKPLRFHPPQSGLIDEYKLYRNFRKKQPQRNKPLKILIVGELSFNPERIYAFEEAGHEIYTLWAENCWWFHTVGPLPFGNVKEISKNNWKEEIKRIEPDIIYGLLSALVTPLVSEVVSKFPKIPFVWHFKESPFYARQNGLWDSIQFLFNKADGIIYINEDIRHFYHKCFPKTTKTNFLILDGELPKINWFKEKKKPLLSESIGGFHTVVPGRPLGLTSDHIGELAKNNIHLHFYGEKWHGNYHHFVKSAMKLAPDHIHLHPNCDQEDWTEELSQYNAGWLHFFESKNRGDILRLSWEDVNIPARMATLATAGLPMLQRDNSGHIVATQTICKKLDIGIFFKKMNELALIFSDKDYMNRVSSNSWQHRMEFSFDHHLPELIDFFYQIIEVKKHA